MAFDWFDNSTGGGLDTSSSAYQDLQDNAGSDGAFGGGLDSAAVTAANSYGSTWDAITGTVGNTLGSLGNWYGGCSTALYSKERRGTCKAVRQRKSARHGKTSSAA